MAAVIFVVNFIIMGMCTLDFTFVAASRNQHTGYCNPEEEVISIYNDDFTTPFSREPFFIKVSRCVGCDADRCGNIQVPRISYPVPDKTNNISIVIKDLNFHKFYKYTVYDHVSCKCGAFKDRQKKLYGKKKEIDESYFEKNRHCNPDKVTDCQTTQKRHRFLAMNNEEESKRLCPSFGEVPTCLPGCKTTANDTKTWNNAALTSPTTFRRAKKCEYYANYNKTCQYPKAGSLKLKETQIEKKRTETSTKLSGYPLTIYIDSTELFLSAFLLALLLVAILIVDFHFCRRKKGFCYSLFVRRV